MTVKKYVNAITRRVKCSREKREEIRRQLSSDISAAIENGETPEQVMERMGAVEDVVNEFNQNLSDQEQKIYKKNRRIRIICEIVAVIVLLSFGVYRSMPKSTEIGTSGVFEKSVVEDTAKQVIENLDAGDFDALKEMAAGTMKDAISAESLAEAKKQISDSGFGEFVSFGQPYMIELEQKGEMFAIAQIAVSYENTSITYTITFDKDMKLSGLYMK